MQFPAKTWLNKIKLVTQRENNSKFLAPNSDHVMIHLRGYNCSVCTQYLPCNISVVRDKFAQLKTSQVSRGLNCVTTRM